MTCPAIQTPSDLTGQTLFHQQVDNQSPPGNWLLPFTLQPLSQYLLSNAVYAFTFLSKLMKLRL